MSLINISPKFAAKLLCISLIAFLGLYQINAQENPAAKRFRSVQTADPYSLDSINVLYVKNPDLAITRIDSLRARCEAQGWEGVSRPRLEMINALIYTYKENPTKTIHHAFAVLAATEELTEENVFWRLMSLQYISLAYSASENWFMTARTLHQMETLANGRKGYDWYESVAQMIRSKMLAQENQIDNALKAIDKAQGIMARDTSRNGQIIAFQNRLDTERFKAEINLTAGRLTQSKANYFDLLDFVEQGDSLMCNKSLYDLTRLRAYAMLCDICEKLGEHEEAADYYNKVITLQCEYKQGHSVTTPLATYLLRSGRHIELEALLLPILNQAHKEGTVSPSIPAQMQLYIRMLRQSGRLSECAEWGERYIQLNNSLKEQTTRRALDEFEIAYQVKEGEELILRQKHAILRQNVWMGSLIAFALLLIIGISLTYYLLCKHRRNNRFLFKRIQETNAAFEQLTRLAIIPTIDNTENNTPILSHEQCTTRDVREHLLNNNLYLDKNLSLEKVVRYSGLSVITLNKRLNVVIGMSLAEYVTFLRLDYACKLLLETNLTIDAVADDSGFKTTRTFLRQFKSKYNLSPTQFRKEKEK